MAWKSDATHWGSLAKWLHWLVVLLIIVQGVLGLYMVELPKTPRAFPYYNWHKSIGMTVLLVAVLRLGWRAFDARPQEPAATPPWQALAARAGHALLYVLLLLVPLSGWWFDSVSGLRPMSFFGWFDVPHLVAPDDSLKPLAHAAHEWLFWALVAVACGHAAMALIHEFFLRDATLARMLPRGWRSVPNAAPQPAIPIDPPSLENSHGDSLPASEPAVGAADRSSGT